MNLKVIALVLLLLASAASATVDGKIKRVDWGISGESEPITVKPMIMVENTGDEKARFHIMVTVDGGGSGLVVMLAY
jgi:hypothetical protein